MISFLRDYTVNPLNKGLGIRSTVGKFIASYIKKKKYQYFISSCNYRQNLAIVILS